MGFSEDYRDTFGDFVPAVISPLGVSKAQRILRTGETRRDTGQTEKRHRTDRGETQDRQRRDTWTDRGETQDTQRRD